MQNGAPTNWAIHIYCKHIGGIYKTYHIPISYHKTVSGNLKESVLYRPHL